MTAKRDLKRRVRERQGRTGESYTTALRQVREQRTTAVPVVEMIDLSEIGAALGLACPVKLAPVLADRIDAASVLRKLRAALGATARDPAFDLMRAVLLDGANPLARPSSYGVGRRFLDRAHAGIGGISEHGRLLAMMVEGRRGAEMVVFMLQLRPVNYPSFRPSLIVTSCDGAFDEPRELMMLWR